MASVNTAPIKQKYTNPKRCNRLYRITAKHQGPAINTSAAAMPPKSQKKTAIPILNRMLTWLSAALFQSINQAM